MGDKRRPTIHRVLPVLCSLLVNGVLAFCLVRLAAAPAAPRVEIAVELDSALTVEDAPVRTTAIPDFEAPAPPPPAPKPAVQQAAPKTVDDILKAFPLPPEERQPDPQPEQPRQEDPPPVQPQPDPPPAVPDVTPDPPRETGGNGGGNNDTGTPAPAGTKTGSNAGDGGGTKATGPGTPANPGDGDGSGHGTPGNGQPGGDGDGSGSGPGKPGPGSGDTPRDPAPRDNPPKIEVPPPPPPPAPKVVRAATVTRKSEPRYPSDARRDGVEGTAVVRIHLNTAGKVTDVEIVTSTGDPRLDAAAIADVKAKWRFTPKYEDDTPVESTIKVRLEFKLNR
jgi:TonB family protein